MSEKRWKRFERRVARLFGCRRRKGSGSDPDTGLDDIVHPRLHVEAKHREKQAVFTTWRKIVKKANREGKRPVLVLGEARSSTVLVVLPLNSQDLYEMCLEMDVAQNAEKKSKK